MFKRAITVAQKLTVPNKHQQQKRGILDISTEGGRSSVSGVVVTVFGCTGFLGRYVVNSLGSIGSQIVVPYRGTEMVYTHLKVMGDLGQIVPVPWDIRDKDSIRRAAKHSNVIVNLVGEAWQTKSFTLNEVHVEGARRIAEVAKEFNVDRLIHVSALGNDNTTDWYKSKVAGEAAVKSVFPDATILRLAPLWGAQDELLNKYSQIIRYWPFFPLIHPNRKMQPVWVTDVANALINSLTISGAVGKTYELAGSKIVTEREIAEWVNVALKARQKIIEVDENTAWHLGYWGGQLRKPKFTPDNVKDTGDVVASGNYPGLKELGVKEPLSIFSQHALGQILWYRKPIRQLDITMDQDETIIDFNKATGPSPF